MAKDPAFLFYPGDYITGTMGMTFEEKGAYMELLMMQFNRGHMSERMIDQVIGQLWDTLKDKFVQDDEGLWYNVRLEEEKIKRQNFTESRRNNIEGKNQYTKKQEKQSGHTTSRMENENENINEDKDVKIQYAEFVKLTENEYKKLCSQHSEYWAKKMIEILDNYKGSSGKKYKSDYRAILNWVVGRVKESPDYAAYMTKRRKQEAQEHKKASEEAMNRLRQQIPNIDKIGTKDD